LVFGKGRDPAPLHNAQKRDLLRCKNAPIEEIQGKPAMREYITIKENNERVQS
jgi:hypothetical protein